MRILIARNWWSLVLRGVLAIIAGLFTFAWPGITLFALVMLFGAYALIDGVLSLAGVFRASRANERWGALLIEGIIGIAAAVITIAWPGITALGLVLVIAAWAVVTGAFEIVAAIRLRKHIAHEWLLGLSGVVSIIFGALMAAAPVAGALAIALWFGAYAIIFGALLVGLGLRLRSWGRTHPAEASPIAVPS